MLEKTESYYELVQQEIDNLKTKTALSENEKLYLFALERVKNEVTVLLILLKNN